MMIGATAQRIRRLAWRVSAIAAGAFLAACGGQIDWTGAPGSLAKPVHVIVGEFESAPDIAIADPAFAAAISWRMSGLTDYSIRGETAKRAGAVVRQQLVASLRAGGLPAEAADTESARGDVVNLLVTGRLRSLDDAVVRQRKLAPVGAGRSRIVADIKVVHAGITLDTKTLASFEAEDNAPAGRPADAAGRRRGLRRARGGVGAALRRSRPGGASACSTSARAPPRRSSRCGDGRAGSRRS